MLYTSYFSNPIKLPKETTYYTGIVAYKPSWWEGPNYTKLAPPTELLNYYNQKKRDSTVLMEEIQRNYIMYYIQKVLNNISIEDVVRELEDLAHRRGKEDIVLLCFEKSSDFCHRHLVRAHLNENGFLCKELGQN